MVVKPKQVRVVALALLTFWYEYSDMSKRESNINTVSVREDDSREGQVDFCG